MPSRFFFVLLIAISVALCLAGCSDHSSSTGPSAPPAPGPNITANKFLPNGTEYLRWRCAFHPGQSTPDSALADTALAGDSIMWRFDLPNYQVSGIDCMLYFPPAEAHYGSLFPTATRAVTSNNYGNYDYYSVTSQGYYWLGWAYDQYDTCRFSQPMRVLKLPLTMGTTWTGVNRQYFIVSGDTVWWIDSVFYRADGWGTVTWPMGEDTCLKVTAPFRAWWVYYGYCELEQSGTQYFWLDEHGEFLVDVLDRTNSYNDHEVYVNMRMNNSPAGPLANAPNAGLPEDFSQWRHPRAPASTPAHWLTP